MTFELKMVPEANLLVLTQQVQGGIRMVRIPVVPESITIVEVSHKTGQVGAGKVQALGENDTFLLQPTAPIAQPPAVEAIPDAAEATE